MPHFDLAIIGSGSGNSVVTPEFDDWRVAVIEDGVFGGTCLNVGCIPTKMYVYPADMVEMMRHLSSLGVDASVHGLRWHDVRDRIYGRIDPISAGGREYRATGKNTTLFETTARFTGPHELALSDGRILTADRIVIAAGSQAVIPDLVAGSGVPYLTSNTILRVPELPRRLAILGGGYIAAECAHIASAFGSEVTVIARGDTLLRHLDADVARRFTALAAERWDVRLGHTLTDLAGDAHGVRLTLDDGTTVAADALLVATGRAPRAAGLGLGLAGVAVHPDGRIVTDEYLRTTAAGIWTLGDVTSIHLLKHVANRDARVVAHNMAHPDDLWQIDDRFVPSAIFTWPQIATVGRTEQQARDDGVDVVTSVQNYGGTAYGWAMEDTTSFCKLVADRASGLLVGAHLIGPQASLLIQPLIQGMSFGQRVAQLARGQFWIHPALTEVVENALLSLDLG